MRKKTKTEEMAANLLKSELTRRGMSYDDLRVALEKEGIQDTAANLNVKINRGRFSFAFFLECAKAIGLTKLEI